MNKKGNWTVGRNGRSNSSRYYLQCVAMVENIVRNAHVGDDPYLIARSIVSHLAHTAKLRPRAETGAKE